jgi:macrolide transport system ATP-binding/permease protein
MALIELDNVSKSYRMGAVEVAALRDVTLQIEAGEFVAIMGPSGSGKSTLLHLVGLLDRPDHGSYRIGGRDVSRLDDTLLAAIRNRLMGFVFQQFYLLPRLSARDNAALPLIYAGRRALENRAAEKIEVVGLGHRANHLPSELSGGEQQRVAIARALVNDPLIILADEPTGNLDSHSEQEIMAILRELNESGKTIVMVTHEEEIARYASRVIRMRDGQVVSDQKQGSVSARPATANDDTIVAALATADTTGGTAQIFDHLRQAALAIVSHKVRSVLSLLGILIGVAAVIAMLALGEGAKESIARQLASLGSNLLSVRPGSRHLHGVALEAGAVTRLTFRDAEAISRLSGVTATSPSVRGRVQVVFGNHNWNTQVEGTGADYATMRAAVPVIGEFFTEEQVRARQRVVLLGATVVRELFGDINPVGATVKINRINFSVLGVLPEKGASAWRDQDDVAVIPITTAMYRLLGKEYVDSIDVEVRSPELMPTVENAIRELIIKRHRLGENGEDSFQIRNLAEIQETLSSTTETMSWLMGSIAGISLLVGGIGIMNIMLVSVTERTREIGLRKALGARSRDIMSQFLVEAIVMTFAGGIIGVVLGSAVAVLLSLVAGWATKVSVGSILLAAGFAIGVGILFGLWPAHQASRLHPIEALRHE